VEEQHLDLRDFITILRRRKKAMYIIATTLVSLIILVTVLLPSIYKSSATILIEQQEVPRELVMSTVTSYAAERIQTIQAQVMSRINLIKIIEKFNLYEDDKKYRTTEAIIARMRDDVSLDLISADIVDPTTGRPSSATIAFSLSYSGKNPAQVQKVVSELTSLYLNKNIESRSTKASETAGFFKGESERIVQTIADLEKKLAEFKQNNAKMLPEVQQVNMQMLQRIESSISATTTRLLNLEERKFNLEGQLSQVSPENPLLQSAGTRLKLLEAAYASLVSKYSESHPDVIRIKNEMDALRSGKKSSDADILASELIALKNELDITSKKYTDQHPDVTALKTKIASLEKKFSEVNTNRKKSDDELQEYLKESPDNPAYITLRSQLDGIMSEMNALNEQKKELIEKQDELEKIMLIAPQVEREYLVLQRDYENALRLHHDIAAKQRSADIAVELESQSKGERFTLIDPPAFPEEPVSPNRPLVILIGLIFSIAAAFGYAFTAEAVSGTVRGANGVESILDVAPLSIVPYQLTLHDIEADKLSQRKIMIAVSVLTVLVIVFVHFFIARIDVLWFRIFRHIESFLG